MHRLSDLHAPSGAFGIAVAALLALVALLALPAHERRYARGPFLLLLAHLAALGAGTLFAAATLGAKIAQFIAVFTLLASGARSVFLLLTRSKLARRLGRRVWPKILRDVVEALLYFGILMIALRAVGVEPGSLLTTSALLTAVIGLSLQETLGNLFAGLALQGQRTLNVGDWVRIADGPDGVGEVVEINWRATHFLTISQVNIIVPNAVIARSTIRNYSRPTRVVRHDVEVVASYDASPERVRRVLLTAIRDSPGVLHEPEPFVVIGAFNDAGITYSVRYFIDDFGRLDPIESGVRQRVLYAFHREKLEHPFPHLQVLAPGLELASSRPGPPAEGADSVPSPPADPGLTRSLAEFDIFRGLEPGALEKLGAASRRALYGPSETIVRQGETGAELFLLEQGDVEVVVAPDGQAPVQVARIGAGSVFGEAALLTGEARTASVVALTECEVLVVPRRAFKNVIDAYPDLSERLTNTLASRMDELSQSVNDAETGEHLDAGPRSDLLLRRIRSFFGSS